MRRAKARPLSDRLRDAGLFDALPLPAPKRPLFQSREVEALPHKDPSVHRCVCGSSRAHFGNDGIWTCGRYGCLKQETGKCTE